MALPTLKNMKKQATILFVLCVFLASFAASAFGQVSVSGQLRQWGAWVPMTCHTEISARIIRKPDWENDGDKPAWFIQFKTSGRTLGFSYITSDTRDQGMAKIVTGPMDATTAGPNGDLDAMTRGNGVIQFKLTNPNTIWVDVGYVRPVNANGTNASTLYEGCTSSRVMVDNFCDRNPRNGCGNYQKPGDKTANKNQSNQGQIPTNNAGNANAEAIKQNIVQILREGIKPVKIPSKYYPTSPYEISNVAVSLDGNMITISFHHDYNRDRAHFDYKETVAIESLLNIKSLDWFSSDSNSPPNYFFILLGGKFVSTNSPGSNYYYLDRPQSIPFDGGPEGERYRRLKSLIMQLVGRSPSPNTEAVKQIVDHLKRHTATGRFVRDESFSQTISGVSVESVGDFIRVAFHVDSVTVFGPPRPQSLSSRQEGIYNIFIPDLSGSLWLTGWASFSKSENLSMLKTASRGCKLSVWESSTRNWVTNECDFGIPYSPGVNDQNFNELKTLVDQLFVGSGGRPKPQTGTTASPTNSSVPTGGQGGTAPKKSELAGNTGSSQNSSGTTSNSSPATNNANSGSPSPPTTAAGIKQKILANLREHGNRFPPDSTTSQGEFYAEAALDEGGKGIQWKTGTVDRKNEYSANIPFENLAKSTFFPGKTNPRFGRLVVTSINCISKSSSGSRSQCFALDYDAGPNNEYFNELKGSAAQLGSGSQPSTPTGTTGSPGNSSAASDDPSSSRAVPKVNGPIDIGSSCESWDAAFRQHMKGPSKANYEAAILAGERLLSSCNGPTYAEMQNYLRATLPRLRTRAANAP